RTRLRPFRRPATAARKARSGGLAAQWKNLPYALSLFSGAQRGHRHGRADRTFPAARLALWLRSGSPDTITIIAVSGTRAIVLAFHPADMPTEPSNASSEALCESAPNRD